MKIHPKNLMGMEILEYAIMQVALNPVHKSNLGLQRLNAQKILE